MLNEIIQALEEGKRLSISAKVVAYDIDSHGTKHSITLIFNNDSVYGNERQRNIAFGVSFSVKKFLNSLQKLEDEGALSVRKSSSDSTAIYLIDGDEGRIQATIIIREGV